MFRAIACGMLFWPLTACSPAPVAIESAKFAASLNIDLAQSLPREGGMYIRDLEVGSGPAPRVGSMVSVRYSGWLADGALFDAATTRPFQFRLGAGQVIAGWDIGVAGIQVGGTRQLIIPPELGYGESGSGPIPGNAILVFEVTLVSSP
jgi:FKBP-type peptidyl-prolyl cis-trans isomerase